MENDLRFSAHFFRAGEKQPDAAETCTLLGAILAHGCNLGLRTMEKLAPDLAYGSLKQVSDWRRAFNDFAPEFYSFVVDNYAPFYSRPVECTDRAAPFVLDGVLYHESDLDLEEHYTDTTATPRSTSRHSR